MKKYLEPPTNWQDFEDLCYLLWKFMWKDRHARKNGRQGQAQFGVDVYGQPLGESTFEGVQCKGKNNYLDQKLTISEIESELNKAVLFSPKIKTLIFATTALSDARLLEKVRLLCSKPGSKIKPSVKSWDEIDVDIRAYPEVFRAFYSDSRVSVFWKRVGASAFVTEVSIQHVDQSIFDLMMADLAKMHVSNSIRYDLKNLAIELALNSVQHGGGRGCQLSIHQNEFHVLCEGKFFDIIEYLSNPKAKRGGGMVEVEGFLRSYEKEAHLECEKLSDGSLYRFVFKSALHDVFSTGKPYIIDFDGMVFRGVAGGIEIPRGIRNLVLDLHREDANLSNVNVLVREILRKMDESSTLKVNLRQWDDFRSRFLCNAFEGDIQSGRLTIERIK